MILKLTSPTGNVYVDFTHVALWRDGYERGSVLVFSDADHMEICVLETADQINDLLKGQHAPAKPTTADEITRCPNCDHASHPFGCTGVKPTTACLG